MAVAPLRQQACNPTALIEAADRTEKLSKAIMAELPAQPHAWLVLPNQLKRKQGASCQQKHLIGPYAAGETVKN